MDADVMRAADRSAELERIAEEQAALRRVATLVGEGADESELAGAVTAEIGRLFGAQQANTMRWNGSTLRVISAWSANGGQPLSVKPLYSFGGDTISARVVETAAPARLNSAADLQTEFGRARWAELGLQASIGAPVVVGGRVWGVVTASRTQPDDPFPPGAEERLREFASLVAQAIVNAEARREVAALVAEQSALRATATLVAAGRAQTEVLSAVTRQAGAVFAARVVSLVRWAGVLNEVEVVAAWTSPEIEPILPGSLYHPSKDGATLAVLEQGFAARSEEMSPERGQCVVIAAPVIIDATLFGALTASRPASDRFPAGAEIRLRSFADLAAQSIANEQARTQLRESRARIVRTADETRRRLERNLHDGAQQRLASLALSLRMAESKLDTDPDAARRLLAGANSELQHALEELRELARGLHPGILSNRGLGSALEALAQRSPVPVTLDIVLSERPPEAVEVAMYYVAAESLTNTAKHARASQTTVRARCEGGTAEIEIVDDGVGGADVSTGTGIRGLADRIEALDGRFQIDSEHGCGTRLRAEIPVAPDRASGSGSSAARGNGWRMSAIASSKARRP